MSWGSAAKIAVDDRLATTAPGIWAVGDVKGGAQFTFVSLDDSRIYTHPTFTESLNDLLG